MKWTPDPPQDQLKKNSQDLPPPGINAHPDDASAETERCFRPGGPAANSDHWRAEAADGNGNASGNEAARRAAPDLDLPECLLIKPIRLWLHGPENWQLIGVQYRAHFGEQAGTVGLIALKGMIEAINAGAKRMMNFRKAWSCLVTGDERALVALGAALQAGDAARARAMAERLVSSRWQGPLIKEMETLMAVFSLKRHRLVHLPPRGRRRKQMSPVAREWQSVVNDLLLDAGDYPG